ncbi:MAG: DNA-3-methyladenine glycosylase, partial [Chitinophagaceae bacterium]|nr:DNA-3-methyladenine glycosylase [Chitinophagaceae bacterium]
KGIDIMLQRTGKKRADHSLTRGPGNVSKAMGIFKYHTGCDLFGKEITVFSDGISYPDDQVIVTPRIGVDYAGEDAKLLYRFLVKDNPYVSKMPYDKNKK